MKTQSPKFILKLNGRWATMHSKIGIRFGDQATRVSATQFTATEVCPILENNPNMECLPAPTAPTPKEKCFRVLLLEPGRAPRYFIHLDGFLGSREQATLLTAKEALYVSGYSGTGTRSTSCHVFRADPSQLDGSGKRYSEQGLEAVAYGDAKVYTRTPATERKLKFSRFKFGAIEITGISKNRTCILGELHVAGKTVRVRLNLDHAIQLSSDRKEINLEVRVDEILVLARPILNVERDEWSLSCDGFDARREAAYAERIQKANQTAATYLF